MSTRGSATGGMVMSTLRLNLIFSTNYKIISVMSFISAGSVFCAPVVSKPFLSDNDTEFLPGSLKGRVQARAESSGLVGA